MSTRRQRSSRLAVVWRDACLTRATGENHAVIVQPPQLHPVSQRPPGVAAGIASPAIAQSVTKLKMVLNWRYQGPQGFFFLAQDKAISARKGLEIDMDQGNGSGAAVGAVASGSYDLGFGDINALITLAAKAAPGSSPLAIAALYNRPPFTIAVRADSPIKAPKDFEGRTIGGPPTTAR